MIALLWVVFGLNFLGGLFKFFSMKNSSQVRTDVAAIVLNLGIAGWSLYFIINGI